MTVSLPGCGPIERPDSPTVADVAGSSSGAGGFSDEYEMVDTFEEPVLLIDVPAGVRALERGRRASRPANPNREWMGLTYDRVVKGLDDDKPPRAKPAEPMTPTSCKSVEPAPKSTDRYSGPHHVHDLAVIHFENSSGFGLLRMGYATNERGVWVASKAIDRVELVSLLTEPEPSVYVLDEMATPPLARKAKRRPLDGFEERGLEAVRRGEHLVWTPEAPTRMFGAIRARAQCLDCHASAKKGDLLGAFTYYLTTPVDQLAKRDRK